MFSGFSIDSCGYKMKKICFNIMLFITVIVIFDVAHAVDLKCPSQARQYEVVTAESKQVWCAAKRAQRLFHGPFRAWYVNGVLGTVETYDHGKLTGAAEYWYESGTKQAQGSFKNGARDGAWTYWDKDGKVAGRAVYSMGKIMSGNVPGWAKEKAAP